MQTTTLPSSHLPSVHSNATDSSASKMAQAAAKFSEAMHRALTGVDANSHQQSNFHSSELEEPAPKSKSASHETNADKKHTKTKKNSEHTASQFLGMSGASATPQRSPVQQTGSAHDSSENNGSTTSIPLDTSKHETVDATDDAETADQSTDPDSSTINPTTGTQISAENPEHGPASNATTAQQLAEQSVEPNSDPANPAEATASGGPDLPITPILDAKLPVAQPGASLSDTRGTSAAKQDMTMKKAEKTPKVAGPAEQDLPGIATIGSEEMPKGQKLSTKDDGHASEKLENAAVEVPLRILTPDDSSTPTVTAATPASTPALDARIMERTHDIVALHAMRVGEYTSDSLHVVVKPGAGIQLSLELRQSARGIEVHASLHKGDFAQLNEHWSDLQQRLEARGVRMGALTTSENFSSTSHQQFQQSKQQSPNQDPLYAGAFAEFALAGSMTEAPAARAARATAYRGWETWA
jgi:hypothetical protein